MQQALLSLPHAFIDTALDAYVALGERHVAHHLAAGPAAWAGPVHSLFDSNLSCHGCNSCNTDGLKGAVRYGHHVRVAPADAIGSKSASGCGRVTAAGASIVGSGHDQEEGSRVV